MNYAFLKASRLITTRQIVLILNQPGREVKLRITENNKYYPFSFLCFGNSMSTYTMATIITIKLGTRVNVLKNVLFLV